MSLYLELFLTFFRIGAFSFGGGYAMLPLLEKEVVTIHHWISMERMLDLISVSQMTPGPLAINMATFAGFEVGGTWGSAVATLGVVTPSAIIIMVVVNFFLKFQEHQAVQGVMAGIRPLVVSLLAAATLSVARSALIGWQSFVIFVLALLVVFRSKVHPIVLIVAAGLLGLFGGLGLY